MDNLTQKKRILILEDEYHFQLIIKSFLDKIGRYEFDIASSYTKALKLLKKHDYDLALLDIEIDSDPMTGAKVAQQIRKKKKFIPITFLTSNFNQVYYDSVKVFKPHSFLDKNLSQVKINQAIELAIQANEDSNLNEGNLKSLDTQNLMIKIGAKFKRIPTADIEFLHKRNGLSYIKYNNRFYPLNQSLNKLEDLFGESFIRVHQSYLVNVEKISHIKYTEYEILVGEERIPIGVTYRKKISAFFTFLS